MARSVPDERLVITDTSVDLAGRATRVRLYRPARLTGSAPGFLFLHGGGFFGGSIENSDPHARMYALHAQCVVASLDYRLAPEHPWPAATDDAWAALQWLAGSATQLEIDPARIAIGGVSAGANIAAVTAIRARDEDGPRLVLQLLEIPVVDLTQSSASMSAFATGYITTRAELAEGNAYYVPDPTKRADPRVSPVFARDLAGLPPAFILINEFDPLRDEGEQYATRLREAGVRAELVRARGHVHGSTLSSAWWLPSARRYQRRTAAALRDAFAVNAAPTDHA
ncbi:MAG TPA: alpha/beta hydrolase [Jatrophihabitantaceae bacterium]|nr:alpha/beta hydrolase [Jatrophihabitantaceae bacterium]